MTVEQKDKLLTELFDTRNKYVEECEKSIAEKNGKIEGAYYMALKFADIIRIYFEAQESENEK